MLRFFTTSVLVILSQLIPAWAQVENQNWTSCLNSDPAVSIKGCTAVIESRGQLPADLANAYKSRGDAYLSTGEYDGAIKDYSEVIHLRPEDASAFNNRGTAYVSKGEITGDSNGEYDRAIKDYSQSLRLKPAFPEALYNRGNVYLIEREYGRAVEDYDRSLQLDAFSARTLFARGTAKQQMGDLPGAAVDLAAAKKIDAEVADKVMKSGKSTAVLVSPASQPQPLFQPKAVPDSASSPAECPVFQGALSAHPYLDDTPEQLKKSVPALRGFVFQADQNMKGDAGAFQSQARTASILQQTGAVVATLLLQMPNLSAREEVMPMSESSPATGDSLPGDPGWLHSNSGQSGRTASSEETPKTVFSYRIVARKDPVYGRVLDESRVDVPNQSGASAIKNSNPNSTGFGVTWLIFLPANLDKSRFRLLGMQRIGNRETYVLGFAQIPERSSLRTVVNAKSARCSSFMQGVAWIDKATFRIVRMQTDLLYPLPDVNLNQLRSTVDYSEVKIPQHELSLWLPRQIQIEWRTVNKTGGERHRYSNYNLFEATSTIHYNPN